MILVKFEKDIKGTSGVKGYEGWIEFESYALSCARHIEVLGADRDVGNAHISELMLTKGADKTSPEFFIQSLIGKAFDKATIVVLHAAGTDTSAQKLVTIELTNPIVSVFSTECRANSRPEERISLNFTKIDYEYHHFDGGKAQGSVKKSFDLLAKA